MSKVHKARIIGSNNGVPIWGWGPAVEDCPADPEGCTPETCTLNDCAACGAASNPDDRECYSCGGKLSGPPSQGPELLAQRFPIHAPPADTFLCTECKDWVPAELGGDSGDPALDEVCDDCWHKSPLSAPRGAVGS